jgi:hypothetical protein
MNMKICDWCGDSMRKIDTSWHTFWRCFMTVWLCNREGCGHELEGVDE